MNTTLPSNNMHNRSRSNDIYSYDCKTHLHISTNFSIVDSLFHKEQPVNWENDSNYESSVSSTASKQDISQTLQQNKTQVFSQHVGNMRGRGNFDNMPVNLVRAGLFNKQVKPTRHQQKNYMEM